MKEVKSPKKPLIYYYCIVLLVLMVFNSFIVPLIACLLYTSRPALDCPVLFTFAPNAVVYGFIFTTIGTVIGMFLWPLFGLPMVIPGIMSNFFAGGTAAIFANAMGGRRGTIIASIVHGLFISLMPAIIAPYLGQIVIEGLPSLCLLYTSRCV